MSRGKTVWLTGICCIIFTMPVHAELYIAGQVGANIPQDYTDIRGIESFSGTTVSDLDLRNQIAFGVKVGGYLRESLSWLGFEGEFYHSDSDIKAQATTTSGPIPISAPGGGGVIRTDIATNTIGLNLLARYPGKRFQPYVGIGPGINVFSVTAPGVDGLPTTLTLNILAGIRGFVTERVALFAEYKYNRGSLDMPDVGIEGDYRVNLFMGGISYSWK